MYPREEKKKKETGENARKPCSFTLLINVRREFLCPAADRILIDVYIIVLDSDKRTNYLHVVFP